MSKKMMIVCGSPRKNGNTMTMANWVAGGARDAGAEVEIVDAASLDYKVNGCTACMSCQKSDEFRCVIEDEASPIIARMPEQDAIVFATPVYFMGFSAQIKLFLDRMFSLVKIRGKDFIVAPGLQGTRLALIASGAGGEKDGLTLLEENMKSIGQLFKQEPKCLMVPFAPMAPGAMETNEELREKAVALGAELAR